jgi:anoctamin-8
LQQLAALLITRQVIGNVKEAVIPFVKSKIKLFKMGRKLQKDMEKKEKDEKKEGETSNGSAGVAEVTPEGSELRQRKIGGEDGEQVEVKKSGPQLTQAEIEASQNEVRLMALYTALFYALG